MTNLDSRFLPIDNNCYRAPATAATTIAILQDADSDTRPAITSALPYDDHIWEAMLPDNVHNKNVAMIRACRTLPYAVARRGSVLQVNITSCYVVVVVWKRNFCKCACMRVSKCEPPQCVCAYVSVQQYPFSQDLISQKSFGIWSHPSVWLFLPPAFSSHSMNHKITSGTRGRATD